MISIEVEQARRDRYSRELPGVLAQQRVLFEELKAAGLVGMLEQIIYPDTLYLPPTDEDRSHMMERIYEKAKTLPAVIPQEMSRKIWNDMENQKWQGRVLYPSQREDGSLDPSLRIAIDDQVVANEVFADITYSVRKLVEITYTTDRNLTIKGQEEITFKWGKTAGPKRPNQVTLVTALGRSFLHPQMVDPIPDY